MFEAAKKAGKKVVTLVLAGRPYAISHLAEQSDALLYAFYPGPFGGLAIAELIFGEHSPSGRLPVSLPRSVGQLPVYYNARNSYEAMHYCDEKEGALYPFGFGLGYGEVTYENFVLETTDEPWHYRIRFDASNQTDAPLAALPMLFLKRHGGSVIPRREELKGFMRILLQPGEKKQLALVLTKEELSVFNRKSEFVLESGEITFALRDGARTLWRTTEKLEFDSDSGLLKKN